MVWRRNIIWTFSKLKVKEDRLGAVYFSSEVSWLDLAHQGRCVKENWENNNLKILIFFSNSVDLKIPLRGCGSSRLNRLRITCCWFWNIVYFPFELSMVLSNPVWLCEFIVLETRPFMWLQNFSLLNFSIRIGFSCVFANNDCKKEWNEETYRP